MSIIVKKERNSKIEIDLTGSEGNAYVLLGYAKQYSRQLNLNWEEICKKMMSGDYENLVKEFDKNFGDYVDLIR